MHLIRAASLDKVENLGPEHINRRVQGTDMKNYAQLYPQFLSDSLLNTDTLPEDWKYHWDKAQAKTW